MEYKLLNVDDKQWLCLHKHFFERLSEWLTLDRKFCETNCFSNSRKVKKAKSDVVSLRAEFFQFDTCGCKISLVPYQKIKFWL